MKARPTGNGLTLQANKHIQQATMKALKVERGYMTIQLLKALLAYMAEKEGWGKKRLEEGFNGTVNYVTELFAFYEDCWPEKVDEILRRKGVELDEERFFRPYRDPEAQTPATRPDPKQVPLCLTAEQVDYIKRAQSEFLSDEEMKRWKRL